MTVHEAAGDLAANLASSLTGKMDEFFGAGGKIAAAAGSRFEYRPQQLAMATAVAKTLASGRHSVIEAPTGTGKSLAYLIPSALWALATHGRVVVSTNTINLQEQLIGQEVPFIREKLAIPVRACLMKGRQNYLCPRRLELVRTKSSRGGGGWSRDVWRIAEAFFQNGARTRSELSFSPRAGEWEKVCCSAESCLGKNCPFIGCCPFFQARAEAARAHVVIINHHLFFSDLRVRESTSSGNDEDAVLPSYDCVVFDEAHNLEDVATEYLGASIGEESLRATLASLVVGTRPGAGPATGVRTTGRKGTRRKRKGASAGDTGAGPAVSDADLLTAGVLGLLAELELPSGLSVATEHATARALTDARRAAEHFSGSLNDLVASLGRRAGRTGEQDARWRITEDVRSDAMYAGVAEAGRELRDALEELTHALLAVQRQAENWENGEQAAGTLWGETGQAVFQELGTRLESAVERVQEQVAAVDVACLSHDDGFVYWLERNPEQMSCELHAAPVDVSEDFHEGVLRRCHATVATSATLAAAGNLSFFSARTGYARLSPKEYEQHLLDSPFDWPNQALAAVVTNLPEPADRRYPREASTALIEILEASQGRALVLFTSYRMLEDVFGIVEPEMAGLGIALLRQGSAPRGQLLERFRADVHSVLFATDSFWEGVDVPGESLSVVILARLPFRVPTDPILEARGEKLARQGKNSFAEFTVPQALIKFRQGLGRLIRSRSDRGVIIILDNRTATRPYGKAFLKSLPPARLVVDTWQNVRDFLTEFLAEGDCSGATKK